MLVARTVGPLAIVGEEAVTPDALSALHLIVAAASRGLAGENRCSGLTPAALLTRYAPGVHQNLHLVFSGRCGGVPSGLLRFDAFPAGTAQARGGSPDGPLADTDGRQPPCWIRS